MAKKKHLTQEELKEQPINSQAVICNDKEKIQKNLDEAEKMARRLQLKRKVSEESFKKMLFPFADKKIMELIKTYLTNHAKWNNIEVVLLRETVAKIDKYLSEQKGTLYSVDAKFMESLHKFMVKDSGVGINEINDSSFKVDDWITISGVLNTAVIVAQSAVKLDQIWKMLTDNNNGPQKQPPMVNGVYVTSLIDITRTFAQAWEQHQDYGKTIEEIIEGLIKFQIEAGNLPEGSKVESEEELEKMLENLEK